MSAAAAAAEAAHLAGLLDVRGPCTTPLDAAVEYCRARPEKVVPAYLVAMTPHAVATAGTIDAVVGGRRSQVAVWGLWLVAATLWRWAGLAWLQDGVRRDLRQGPPASTSLRFWRRLPAVLLVRLVSNVALTWGGLLVLPGFYGLFVGGFAAPLLLEDDRPWRPRVRACVGWVRYAAKRLVKVSAVMSVVTLLALVAAFVSQAVLAGTVLPSLLGVDTADLTVTLGSWAWRLRLCYAVFLVLDAYWAVACVFLYYDSQSRRMASDLRVRLRRLPAAGVPA